MNKLTDLIPAPLVTQYSEGYFSLKNDTIICYPESFKKEALIFQSFIFTHAGLSSLKPVVDDKPLEKGINFVINQSLALEKEAYTIQISETLVLVSASTTAGAWYGATVLMQLILSHKNRFLCLYIEDKPEYEHRGFMLDCARHYFSLDYIKKMLDLEALHRMNVFHWHLTDDQGFRFDVPQYPRIKEVGSKRILINYNEEEKEYGYCYSDEEIKEVIEYARARHIMVIPEIETPGHASAILASYPNLSCSGEPHIVPDKYGIFKEALCVGNEEVYEFLDAAIGTLARLFDGPYIHIGGDECSYEYWKSCPKCQQKKKELGIAISQLQSYATKRVVNIVKKYGKTAIGWDEVLDSPEGLDPNLVVASWRGIEGGKKAAKLGHKVIMCPVNDGCYLDYRNADDPREGGAWWAFTTTKMAYNFTPCKPSMDKNMVLGGQANLWSESITFEKMADYFIFPRFCAISEALWLPEDKKSYVNFKTRLQRTHKTRLQNLNIMYFNGPLG